MFQYEKLESEKYLDKSVEQNDKRRQRFQSLVDTIWSMTAVMTLTMVAGVFFLQFSSEGIADLIYSFVSVSG